MGVLPLLSLTRKTPNLHTRKNGLQPRDLSGAHADFFSLCRSQPMAAILWQRHGRFLPVHRSTLLLYTLATGL